MRVLILGTTGILGHAMVRGLHKSPEIEIVAAIRNEGSATVFQALDNVQVMITGDLTQLDQLDTLLTKASPDVVINCVAASKDMWTDWERMVAVFSLLPQRLKNLCGQRGIRLVHFSTDGVFTGDCGNYDEGALPDASDIYGVVKQLGEVSGPGITTIRTSMIGPDYRAKSGFLEWVLASSGRCKGYSKAIFSGLPTIELAHITRDILIARDDMSGLYHIASEPVSKANLIRMICEKYGHKTVVEDDPSVSIDRSLNACKFAIRTGYTAPSWPDLIDAMYNYHMEMHEC